MSEKQCPKCGRIFERPSSVHKAMCNKLPPTDELKKEIDQTSAKLVAEKYSIPYKTFLSHCRYLWPDDYQSRAGKVKRRISEKPPTRAPYKMGNKPRCQRCTILLLEHEVNHCAMCADVYNQESS